MKSLGSQLMAEIRDVFHFQRKQSLVAFAGIDPISNQSGEKECARQQILKVRFSVSVKTLLNIMMTYLQNATTDEPVYKLLDRKRSEVKPYYVYMTAAGNKFLRRYYGRIMNYFAALENLPPVDINSTGLRNSE